MDRFRAYYCSACNEFDFWVPDKNAQKYIPSQSSTHHSCGIDYKKAKYISERELSAGRMSNLEIKMLLWRKGFKKRNF